MAFDKIKTVRAAEKSLARGKISAAVQEYCKIVDSDPNDFSALNTLGDLYTRIDKKQEAITCFTRVAEHFREQGFALKAIAMFKKVSRLNPASIDISMKLAALYDQQDLVVEARAQYLAIADSHTRNGQTRNALDVLRKVADLDPNNTDIRFKIAESYLREGFRLEAGEAFIAAGKRLVERSDYEDAISAYTQALELRPHDVEALGGLTASYSALGTPDKGIEVLEQARIVHPQNVEILSLLARLHVESGNAAEAERSADAFVKLEPTNYSRLAEVARLYIAKGELAEGLRVLSRILEPMLTGREEDALLDMFEQVLAREPLQVDALRMLVRIHTWRRDDDKTAIALERLAESARATGLVDEERSALSQLVWLVPDSAVYRARLNALGGPLETIEPTSKNPPAQAEETVPTFESFIWTDESLAIQAEASEAVAQQTMEIERNDSLAPPPSLPDAQSSFADLNGQLAGTDTLSIPLGAKTSLPSERSDFQEVDFAAAATSASDTASSHLRFESQLGQELESVDFYLGQGYSDIARDTLNMLERQFGPHEDIEARRAQLRGPSTEQFSSAATPFSSAAQETGFQALSEQQESFNSADFASFEAAHQPPAAQPTNFSASAFETNGRTIPAPEEIIRPSVPTIDPELAAIFEEFRAATEDDDPASEGDYETHYNLGIAYKEMDLLDEAIEEFQMAVALVTPSDGTPRYLQCCNLLGHCFMGKDIAQLAAMWFKKGLEAPGHTEDEYQALRYELAIAYEMMGNLEQAITVFTEVYGINVSYRGVSNKLRELRVLRAAK